MSLGSSLREVRNNAGFSTAELAARTRIPESVLLDLEADNFTTCGGAAYARGHIRTIARICQIDPSPLLSQFESQTIPLNKSIRALLNDNSATPVQKVRKPLSWKSLAGVMSGLAIFALVGAAIFSAGQSSQDQNVETNRIVESEPGPVAKKSEGVTVTLRGVNGLSWVAVNDSAGVTQFSGRIRQGEERSFTDDQLIYLVIGNAGAISIIVNGENLGVAGNVGEVVRLEFGPQALSSQG